MAAGTKAQQGFTLAELLVALLIFGMLSAGGVALLSFSVRFQGAADAHLAELGSVRRANALLSADLAQIVPRTSRDEAGLILPAFRGETGEQAGLSFAFVRRGWENVQDRPRASVQKVEYSLAGDRLERRAYPFVDGAAPMPAVPVMEGVRRLRLRYRNAAGEWRERWDPARPTELPRAVEIVALTSRGEIRQLFLTGPTA